jgi:hypothetical protein
VPVQCDSGDLRRRMQHLRERMSVEAQLLNDDAQRLLDWRHYVARYPWWCLGAAAAAGFWLIPGHTVTPTVKLDQASVDELVHQGASRSEQRGQWPRSLLSLAGDIGWRLAMGYLGQQANRWAATALESRTAQEAEVQL